MHLHVWMSGLWNQNEKQYFWRIGLKFFNIFEGRWFSKLFFCSLTLSWFLYVIVKMYWKIKRECKWTKGKNKKIIDLESEQNHILRCWQSGNIIFWHCKEIKNVKMFLIKNFGSRRKIMTNEINRVIIPTGKLQSALILNALLTIFLLRSMDWSPNYPITRRMLVETQLLGESGSWEKISCWVSWEGCTWHCS